MSENNPNLGGFQLLDDKESLFTEEHQRGEFRLLDDDPSDGGFRLLTDLEGEITGISDNRHQYTGPHISQDDWVDISSGGFGIPIFGKGREENMEAKLWSIYNPTRDPNKVQFEQYGAGNNIRVTLPNGDTDEFRLEGAGMFGTETANMKRDHVRLVEFISQNKRKQLAPKSKTQFEDVIFNTEDQWGFDNEVAKQLRLIGLTDENGNSYGFEATSNLWEDGYVNGIEITTPTGAKKVFNISGMQMGGKFGDEVKQKVLDNIINFIEADPRSFDQTVEYNADLKEIEAIIDPFVTEEFIKNKFGTDLMSPWGKETLIEQIKNELGTVGGDFLGIMTGDRPATEELVEEGKVKKFMNLTRDQQNTLIEQKINEYIVSKIDKYRGEYTIQEFNDLLDLGLSEEDIDNKYIGENGAILSRFTNQYDKGIYLNWQKLDDPNATKEEKDKARKDIEFLKAGKENAGLGKKSHFFNINTMEYTYNDEPDEDAGIYDITNGSITTEDGITLESFNEKKSRLEQLMADGKLTREELKDVAVDINLAVDEFNDIWNTKKRSYTLYGEYEKGSSQLKEVTDKLNADGISYSISQAWTRDVQRNPIAYGLNQGSLIDKVKIDIHASDSWIIENKYLIAPFGSVRGVKNDYDAFLSRLSLGASLKTERAVYDHLYGLNETSLSVKQKGFFSSFGNSLVSSVETQGMKLEDKFEEVPTDQAFRQEFNDIMINQLGYEPTAEEKEHVKQTTRELVGGSTGALPKVVFDFWLTSRVLGKVGLSRLVTNTNKALLAPRTTLTIGGRTKSLTNRQLVKHIKKINKKYKNSKYSFKDSKGKPLAAGSDEEIKLINTWLKNNKKLVVDVGVKAHPLNRAAALFNTSMFEGVKMDLAMQMPAIHGFGDDPDIRPDIGSSFATGFGFGFMGGIIPWNKMWTGVMGVEKTIVKNARPGIFGWTAAHKGFKPLPGVKWKGLNKKEIAFKGIYDYFAVAPLNFYAGAQFGSFTNQIADHMMGEKSWNEWLDENYGSWNYVLKHALSELITGLAMRGHKFNKYDFTTRGRLQALRREANREIFGDKKTGKKGIMEEKKVTDDKGKTVYKYVWENGKNVKKPKTQWVLRKGKTQTDLEPFQMVIQAANSRLLVMDNMQMYLDPIAGPIKLQRDLKPFLESLGVEKNTKFTYDYETDGFQVGFVKDGAKFYNPKKDAGRDPKYWTGRENKSGKLAYQAIFNPKLINVGHIPHEMMHIGMHKMFGEDVMFKGKVIDGLIDLAKEMKHEDGTSLYSRLVETGVLKEGEIYDYKKVKEWELFAYVGEFFRQEGNQDMLVEKYGFDKLGSLTDKMIKEKFGVDADRLNTRKDLVEFYVNYSKTIGEGTGIKGNMKHLEKFISPTKTKNQQKRRERTDNDPDFPGFVGRGDTKALKSANLKKKIEGLENKRKTHPAFIQWKEDRDTEKYKNHPEIKKINSDIEKFRKAIENLPEDIIYGKESPIEKIINDFARVGDRAATESEWNAKGGGKEKAINELYDWSDRGAFTKLITKGISFPIEGRSRQQWIEDVFFGIEGKGKKDKTTGKEKATFISTGIKGIIERFNYKFDRDGNIIENLWGTPEQNKSLSGWINSQYNTFRRGEVQQYYKKNPLAKDIETPVGEGKTIGDMLIAGESYEWKRFEQEDLSFGKTKEDALKWTDIVKIQGIKLKHELPISIKEFIKKGGWKESILKEVLNLKEKKDAGPKDLADIAIEWTHAMLGIKLTSSQKKNLSDLGEKNLENLQKWIDKEWKSQVTEVGVDKKTGEIKKKQQKVDDTGAPIFKTVKNVKTVEATINKDATIKFDKGVSEKLKGTSSLKKLGVLKELFHKATEKNYTAKELRDMGYEVNPKPNKDGSWRVATGPGGNIWLPGKSKGKPITSQNIKEFLGKKKDGSWTKLSENRSLGGRGRRIAEVINTSLVEQVSRDANSLDANMQWNLRSSGSSRLWSKYLGREKSLHNRITFAEEVRTSAFYQEFYRSVDEEIKKGKEGSIEKGVVKALVNHFNKVRAKDLKFDMEKKTIENIGKEIYREFKFTKKISPEVIAMKTAKAVILPNDMSAIEQKWKSKGENVEVFEGPKEFFDNKKGDITNGYTQMFEFAKRVDAKYGVGYFEAHFLSGAAEGKGIGKYSNIKNMMNNILGDLRYSLLRGANKSFADGKGRAAEEGMVEYDGYAMLDAVHRSIAKERKVSVGELKKYVTYDKETGVQKTGQTKEQSRETGIKKAIMDAVGIKKGSRKFVLSEVERIFNQGEKNKEALKEGIEDLMIGYKNGEVSQRIVRQWIEMHAGSMVGLIKTSASLAVLPTAKMKDLIKEFGTDPKDWVLEHITPAKYIKARIYDYILSKGDPAMKEALELSIKDHHTTLIPEKYDTAVNKTLKEDLPSSHLPGMDPLYSRYYGASHPIDFNLGLKVHHGHRKGTIYDHHTKLSIAEKQRIGKEVSKNIKKLFPERFKAGTTGLLNSKNLSHLKNIDKALINGRKFDKEKKGMSTWDFDDTLAITKSGVRARIPNADGKPKPSRKVVFLAGGAGSGKSNVVKKLNLEKQGFKVVNSDISLEWLKKNSGLPENMNDLTRAQLSELGKLQHESRNISKRKMMKYQGNAEGVVVDGTGGSIKAMEKLVKEFKDKGYDVSMLFVETSLKTALERNRARKERSLLDKIVEKNHEAVQGNKPGFKEMFGERFMEVQTDKLKQEDAMPADLVAKMNDFVSSYEKVRLDAEQFANKGKEILDKGGEFDFTEFDVVTKGEKGPFFQKALERVKKFGTEHQYVLTARPPEAQIPIYEFLKSQGLEIPLKNIKALGNSTAEAKALWMLEKFAEGYNDMYFADDALQNVKAVKDALKQVDVKSKVVQAKINEARDLNNVKDTDRLDSPDNYTKILNSRNLRKEYEKTISKNRPDLVKEGLVSKSVDEMFKFVEGLNVPVNKRKKYERITTKWLATSNIKLKEDSYKVKEAIEIADKYKEDVFSYKNPNEIIEKYAGKIKEKPTNPKDVKEFSKGKIINEKHGITEYEVSDTKEGQKAVRKVIDTHWGEKSNPWCITQKKKGKLTEDAWRSWENYSGSKSIVFQNGKLLAFKAGKQYWDRMDNPTNAPVVTIKEGRVTKKAELVPMGGGKVEEFVMETRTVSKDKKTVTTEFLVEKEREGIFVEEAGTKIVENKVKGVTVKKTAYRADGSVKRITEYKNNGEVITTRTYSKPKSVLKGKMTSINNGIEGDMTTKEIVKEKGDLITHEIREGKNDHWYGKVLLTSRKTGETMVSEIGFSTGEGFELMDIMKKVNGKLRVDFDKLFRIDPDVKGLPKEIMVDKGLAVETFGMQNTKAVRDVLNQLDIKSETQQTRLLHSKNLSKDINNIIEHSLEIEAKKIFSAVEAKVRGRGIKRRRIIMPDTAADLELLIEPLYGKGEKGIENKKWFEENFYKPWERGVNDLNTARQTAFNDYATLRKENKDIVKSLQKEVKGTAFTNDMAARVYLYNKAGFKIPGLTKSSEKKLVEHVKNSPELLSYAEKVAKLTRVETGLEKPTENWWSETLATEIQDIGMGVSRKRFLQEWMDIKNTVFSPENLNKMESKLGTRWRETIEDMFDRMETGRTRSMNLGPAGAQIMNYLNGSVGTIMNFNTRSAVLQLISTVNFINHAENNPFAAAKAFANQPQYWKDFMKIMNSDMLIQRRAGLRINVTEQELASAAAKSKNKAQGVISWILKQGYIPTKIADSFAIASGGATYYRNRVIMYEKQGLSTKNAEKKAWIDFQAMAEKTQQSSRPDLLSQQQTSFVGRLILPFANTPLQMNRIMMKEVLDLSKGRWDGFYGENSFTNKVSKISYYGVMQSIIFAGLQSALFATLGFDPDSDAIDDKKARTVNTVLDSFLRGMGWQTAVISGVKNSILKAIKENEKGFHADYDEVIEELLNISPTIGSKYRKLDQMGNTYKYNKKEIVEKGLSLDNSPLLEMAAQGTEAIFNIPVHRMMKKTDNIQGALNEHHDNWQRVLMLLGWSKWDVGIDDKEKKEKKEEKDDGETKVIYEKKKKRIVVY